MHRLYKSVNDVWECVYPRAWVRKYGDGSLPKDDADISHGEKQPDSIPIVLSSDIKANVVSNEVVIEHHSTVIFG